jgi:hypothetical protein
MAKKKDENPFKPSADAQVVKPSDLVAENLPPADAAEITPLTPGEIQTAINWLKDRKNQRRKMRRRLIRLKIRNLWRRPTPRKFRL